MRGGCLDPPMARSAVVWVYAGSIDAQFADQVVRESKSDGGCGPVLAQAPMVPPAQILGSLGSMDDS